MYGECSHSTSRHTSPGRDQPRRGVGAFGGLKADPGIDGLHAVRAGEDRAQLEFGDLRQVIGHPGDAQQQIPRRAEVGGGWGAGAPEHQRGGAPAIARQSR